jgi:hypothetical protein
MAAQTADSLQSAAVLLAVVAAATWATMRLLLPHWLMGPPGLSKMLYLLTCGPRLRSGLVHVMKGADATCAQLTLLHLASAGFQT